MPDIKETILIVFALLISVIGLYLMLFPKQDGANAIKIAGFEFQLSTPALVLVVIGGGLLAYTLLREPSNAFEPIATNHTQADKNLTQPRPAVAAIPNVPGTAKKETAERDSEGVAYRLAVDARQRESYASFLARYPKGPYTEDIRARLKSCVQVETKVTTYPDRRINGLDIGRAYLDFPGNYEDFLDDFSQQYARTYCSDKGHTGGTGSCFADKSEAENCSGSTCVSGQRVGYKPGSGTFFSTIGCVVSCTSESLVKHAINRCER